MRMLHVLMHRKVYWYLLTALFLFTLDVSVIAQSSEDDPGKRTVSVSGSNVTLQSVLKSVEKQTGMRFNYGGELNIRQRVSIRQEKVTLTELLSELFNKIGYSWKFIDKNIFLIKSKADNSSNRPTQSGESQLISVAGTVSDTKGAPLSGANIVIKGTSRGAAADAKGRFSLREVSPTSTLQISFTGYVSQELKLNGQSALAIVLIEDISSLDETIIMGYGKTSKRLNTGNISRITAEDIVNNPVSNPLAAMQGRMAGVNIVQNSGIVGSGFSVEIRGLNSLRRNGNYPLYIIDGVPFASAPVVSGSVGNEIIPSPNPLNNINPSDIQSIEVLKDADATAIYGSRGANGVVLITTRTAGNDKTSLTVDFYSGISRVANKMDLLHTEQYRMMRREAFKNDNTTPTLVNAYDLLVWDSTRNIDWQKVLIGNTAHITNAQVSLTGGNISTQFRVGINYHKESTVFPGDYYGRKIGGYFSLFHISRNNRFEFNLQSNYTKNNNNLFKSDLTSLIFTPPNAPDFYNTDGSLTFPVAYTNPYIDLNRKYRLSTDNLINSASVQYRFTPNLKFLANLGFTKMENDEMQNNPQKTISPSSSTVPFSLFANTDILTWIAEPQLSFVNPVGKGTLEVLVGSTFQQSVQEGETLNASGFSSDASMENIKAASSVIVDDYLYSKYKYTAVFGRIKYNLKNKYIVNLTGRRDGSTRFADGNKFANFGAIGAAWIFSEEGFVKNHLNVLSFGKMRASYGTTGNDQIGDYGYLESWKASSYPYSGGNTLEPARIGNNSYQWEINKKLEAAVELGFLDDKIFLSTAYYRNRTSNQLIDYTLPPSVGFLSVQANFPALVQNQGWEFDFNVKPFAKGAVIWKAGINLTIPDNKLVSFPGIENTSYNNIFVVGKSLYVKKAYNLLSVDPETGRFVFEDVDKDGSITSPNDLLGLKELKQEFYGGLQNSIQYKNFDIDVLFQFVKQTGNVTPYFFMPGYVTANQPVSVLDRWQEKGDQATIGKYSRSILNYLNFFSKGIQSDLAIGDASFIRLKNVAISYRIPTGIMNKLKIQSCKIYLLGQNLWTITNYKGLDPENQNVDYLPPLRTLTAGIQVVL